MKHVKFVKATEENKDELARELGWKSEGDLLKDAEFETLVGLWVDSDDDVRINSITDIRVMRVEVVRIDSRRFGDNWYSTVYAGEVDLLIVEPGIGAMGLWRYEQVFC